MSDGYYGMPEATLESRRNLWFHTGDLAAATPMVSSTSSAGDRQHPPARREHLRVRGRGGGEAAPAVLDAAAFGVPSELTEDDVMVAVVARPGQAVDPAELIAFCAERMAPHMVPRYVDVVAELPRTPTEKVEKAVLRTRGSPRARGIAGGRLLPSP